MTTQHPVIHPLAIELAGHYSAFPQVEAVVLAGSQTVGRADPSSDLDLYVYVQDALPLALRTQLVAPRASYAELGNLFWEPGDEWVEASSGLAIDVMFRQVAWIEAQLNRVLQQHLASVGYSTCFWHNVQSSQILFDRNAWFHSLQQVARQPYPEPLRHAIVAKNWPILRQTMSSYRQQIARALNRDDLVSVHHRVTAFLASYFDILFAVNRLPHPGEKRLLAIALERCAHLPDGMADDVRALLAAHISCDQQVLHSVDRLADQLEQLLRAEGLLDF